MVGLIRFCGGKDFVEELSFKHVLFLQPFNGTMP